MLDLFIFLICSKFIKKMMRPTSESDIIGQEIIITNENYTVERGILKHTSHPIFVKKISLSSMGDLPKVQNYISELKKLNHPNIAPIIISMIGGSMTGVPHIIEVMEYYENNLESLISFFRIENSQFSEANLMNYYGSLLNLYQFFLSNNKILTSLDAKGIFIDDADNLKLLDTFEILEFNSRPRKEMISSSLFHLGKLFFMMATLCDIEDIYEDALIQNKIIDAIKSLPYATIIKEIINHSLSGNYDSLMSIISQ